MAWSGCWFCLLDGGLIASVPPPVRRGGAPGAPAAPSAAGASLPSYFSRGGRYLQTHRGIHRHTLSTCKFRKGGEIIELYHIKKRIKPYRITPQGCILKGWSLSLHAQTIGLTEQLANPFSSSQYHIVNWQVQKGIESTTIFIDLVGCVLVSRYEATPRISVAVTIAQEWPTFADGTLKLIASSSKSSCRISSARHLTLYRNAPVNIPDPPF